MKDLRKPSLGADVYEEIEAAQYEVDKIYWAQLRAMTVSPLAALAFLTAAPMPPAQPIRLCRLLGEYGCALFDAEVCRYPASSELQLWLESLADRIASRIINSSSQIEGLNGTLTYHATKEQMRAAVDEALKTHAQARISLLPAQVIPTKPEPIDRKALRDSYLTIFSGVKILDICWAAGQHYREWKRWLKLELKDGSTPDTAFRRVLTSGKKPQELSKKPRPSGWQ